MTHTIRLACPMALSLSDSITHALAIVDRAQKNFIGNQLKFDYVFDFHGIEVPVNGMFCNAGQINDAVREKMKERAERYAALTPSKQSYTVLLAPPQFTGTIVDRLWVRNMLLLVANGIFETDPDTHRFYAVNLDRAPTVLNPWAPAHEINLNY